MPVASPTDANRTLTAFRVENSYPDRLPQPLFDRRLIARGFFFYAQTRKKDQLEGVFLCFSARPRPSPNQAVLAAGLGGAGALVRDFQHYVRS